MVKEHHDQVFSQGPPGLLLAVDRRRRQRARKTRHLPFGGQRGEGPGITATAYKYTDQERDVESGLYNYHARLYDPVVDHPRQYNVGITDKPEAVVESPRQDDPRDRIRTALRLMDISEDLDEKLPGVSGIDLGSGYLDRANELIKANKFEEAREAAAQGALHSTGLATALVRFTRRHYSASVWEIGTIA